MNERERLIELIEDGSCSYLSTEKCKNLMCECRTCCEQVLADYLLKNNVIVLPCKKGEKVFGIAKSCFRCSHYKDDGFCLCEREPKGDLFEVDLDKNCSYEISEMPFSYSMIDDVGETVFLTRYEAEKKLRGEYV